MFEGWDDAAGAVELVRIQDGALEVVIDFEDTMVQSPQVFELAGHCASLVVVMFDTLEEMMIDG